MKKLLVFCVAGALVGCVAATNPSTGTTTVTLTNPGQTMGNAVGSVVDIALNWLVNAGNSLAAKI